MYKLYLFTLLLSSLLACKNNQSNPPAESTPAAPATKTSSLPTGKLVSMDDPQSVIEFRGGQFIETYDGKVMGSYACNFDPTCANCKSAFPEGTSAGTNHMGCFKYQSEGETFSYIILDMSDSRIDYSMIGGRGNTLRYRRAGGRTTTGDQWTVLAKSGVVLREKPDAASNKLNTIPYGEQVAVSGAPGAAFQVQAFPGFKVSGHWVSASAGGKNGYVFDGFLSKWAAPENDPFETVMEGATSTGKTTTNPSKKDKTSTVWMREVETFSNGVSSEAEAYEGGSKMIRRFPASLLSLQDAYLLVHATEQSKGTWSFDTHDKNTMQFETEDGMSVTYIRKDGAFIVVEDQTAD